MVSPSDLQSKVEVAAHASLLRLDAHEKWRLAKVEPFRDGLQVQIFSDGWALNQKVEFEKTFKQELVKLGLERDSVSVYFKKKAPQAPAEPPRAADLDNPFGLTFTRTAIPGVRRVVVVASGKGGVGKSTVSVNLATALQQQGRRVGLLDADVYGPSIPLMMGVANKTPEVNGEALQPLVAHGVKLMSFGFLTDLKSPVIWRGPLVGKALEQFCFSVTWGELDELIVDLPPGTGDVQLTLIEKLPIHGAVIVTTPQDVALADAHKAVTMFQKLNVPVLGVVENMAGHRCTSCGHIDDVFGNEGFSRFAAVRGLSSLGRIPLDAAICAAGDSGRPAALMSDESEFAKVFAQIAAKIVK